MHIFDMSSLLFLFQLVAGYVYNFSVITQDTSCLIADSEDTADENCVLNTDGSVSLFDFPWHC